jgi:hypothetical protein
MGLVACDLPVGQIDISFSFPLVSRSSEASPKSESSTVNEFCGCRRTRVESFLIAWPSVDQKKSRRAGEVCTRVLSYSWLLECKRGLLAGRLLSCPTCVGI